MRPTAILFVAALISAAILSDRTSVGCASPCFAAASRTANADEPPTAWVEAIEVYELPWDPTWREQAMRASFHLSFRRSAEEIEKKREAVKARSSRAKGDEAISREIEELVSDFRASANRSMPLTVVRVWDGIARTERVFTFGRGQRATVTRLAQGKPVLAVLDFARPGDDLQARRPTLGEIRPSSNVPTEFVRFADAPEVLGESRFGEVDASALPSPLSLVVTKDPTPGSGILTLELRQPPEALRIDTRYPWFAEFRLFELTKEGARSREVRFEGERAIVAPITPHQPFVETAGIERNPCIARGRIEVKSPSPWGYEAEVVRWFGVARKDRLVAAPGTGAPTSATEPKAPSSERVPSSR